MNCTQFYTTKFQYAHGLIHSQTKEHIPLGIKLLTELLKEHSTDVQAQRDYGKDAVFYLRLEENLTR